MRPSLQARQAARVTLAKGKSYEFDVPEELHQAIPEGLELESQFPLAVGIIGDAAAEKVDALLRSDLKTGSTQTGDVFFAARVLQAFVDSRTNAEINSSLLLLSSAAHYISGRPGDSAVAVKGVAEAISPISTALKWALGRPWADLIPPLDLVPPVKQLAVALAQHFRDGEQVAIGRQVRELRWWSYSSATPYDLLIGDLLSAVALRRIERSAWTLLPQYSDLSIQTWTPYLQKRDSVQEIWPSQMILGEAGVYRGESAVVQMPTSAGKSRATELMIRSAFLAGRTKLVLVVAPFRALCQEIASSLRESLEPDGYRVNQLSDALQRDFFASFAELLGLSSEALSNVVILTPEKLLYLIRQSPSVVDEVGLVVYDEGHQFDSGGRGVTYELLLTSLRKALPASAQKILISAVIRNAEALADWLLGSPESVVSNSDLQTERSVAFATWPPPSIGSGQVRFLKRRNGLDEFSVPSVITSEVLKLKGKEKKERKFPERNSASIALYLALRVARNGAAAIYCSTKASVTKLVRDAVEEIFGRGASAAPPAAYSNADELNRMEHLYVQHFGPESIYCRAARLGIFAHHSNTPHGIRLAIEHGMRKGSLRLVVCTSTLAQGVNLPIRYLFVTSTMQGGDSISARDFHNLMGRAGRAGMHGEGTVMFTNPELYDDRLNRDSKGYEKWGEVNGILEPESAEPTGSSLLKLLSPIVSKKKIRPLKAPPPLEVVEKLVSAPAELKEGFRVLTKSQKRDGFTSKEILDALGEKEKVLAAVETFLMAYRAESDSEAFFSTSRELAASTFAYSLAGEAEKKNLEDIFEKIARRIDVLVPEASVQARYGRTLLGVDKSKAIDSWIKDNLFLVELVDSDTSLLETIWPLLASLSDEKRLSDTEPLESLKNLAMAWISGDSFERLAGILSDSTYPHGEKRRKFGPDLVIELCEHTFGFQFSHLLGAIGEAIQASDASEVQKIALQGYVERLQKRLRYGLPSSSDISLYEVGLADRVVAQEVSRLFPPGLITFPQQARFHLVRERERVRVALVHFPSYFHAVLDATIR